MSEPSPRTDAEPMAFTRAEFWSGAVSAWMWFVPLAMLPWVVMLGPYSPVALLYIVPWSLGAVVVFFVPAFVLGQALRRQPRVPVHLVAFAALGLLIGASTTAVVFAVDGHLGETAGSTVLAVNLAASAIAVPTGWWRSARRAAGRHALAGRAPGRPAAR